MPKSKNSLPDDADLIAPKLARDEIVQEEPTKSQLKKMVDPVAVAQNINNTFAPTTPISTTTSNTASTPGFGATTPGFGTPNTTSTPGFGSSTPSFGSPSTAPAPQNVYQQQANADIDRDIVKQQLEKENEHWVKAYWRPAMGWLYMLICGMDFVGFPLLTIFLPVIFQPFGLVVPYQTWQSLTLANGGLIHLSFGAILGVAAFTRGQEKIANKT